MDMEKHSTETNVLTDKHDLSWHKPEIERLAVSLDTANETGSGPDFSTHGLNIAAPTGG